MSHRWNPDFDRNHETHEKKSKKPEHQVAFLFFVSFVFFVVPFVCRYRAFSCGFAGLSPRFSQFCRAGASFPCVRAGGFLRGEKFRFCSRFW
jgi:hypothetical protein